MIEEELKEILEKIFSSADNDDYLEAISQIKSLVVESLGEEKEVDKHINFDWVLAAKNKSYNQHISEMKKKWK